LLTERLGNSDATPPQVTIASPGDGESVRPGFKVVVTATDNLNVRSVTLMIDDISVGALTSPPYVFTTPDTLPDGQHFVKAIASDGKNEGNHVTYVTVKADMTTPPGDGGGGCAATSGGGFGAALAVAVGLRRKRRAPAVKA
jgi:MYXO-CTERM domain-containing protein